MNVKKKSALAIVLMVLVVFSLFGSAQAQTTRTVVDEATGISVTGDFSEKAVFTAFVDTIQDNPLCVMRMMFSVWDSTGDYEEADYDTYYGAMTATVPCEESNCRVIAFDLSTGEPSEVPATYKNGAYTFAARDGDNTEFWLTKLTDPIGEVPAEYEYQVLEDKATGITVTGVYPVGTRLLAVPLKDSNKTAWENGEYVPYVTSTDTTEPEAWPYQAARYELKAYCGFHEVEPKSDLLVTIPHTDADATVRMSMTDEEINALTDEQDDGAINWYDRRWYDMDPTYEDGAFTFLTNRLGEFLLAEQSYLDTFGDGTRRGEAPKLTGLQAPTPTEPGANNPKTGDAGVAAPAFAAVAALIAAGFVWRRRTVNGTR